MVHWLLPSSSRFMLSYKNTRLKVFLERQRIKRTRRVRVQGVPLIMAIFNTRKFVQLKISKLLNFQSRRFQIFQITEFLSQLSFLYQDKYANFEILSSNSFSLLWLLEQPVQCSLCWPRLKRQSRILQFFMGRKNQGTKFSACLKRQRITETRWWHYRVRKWLVR